jgi:DNA-binding transcriptional LysR family regulator
MNVTLQRLRYFVAVADELNFTRAAARLHVSQPSLSSQVRALERDLGLELLRRTTRRVELTAAGQVLHQDVRRILDDLDHAYARARRVQDAASVALRVAYTATVGYQALPLILDELEARAPELRLSAYRAWSTDVIEAVRTGDVELGMLREYEATEGLLSTTIRMEPLAVFMSARHRLAKRPTLQIADLEGQTMIGVPSLLAPGFHDLIQTLCARRDFDPIMIDQSAPDNREPLLAHLSRHADLIFVGPVSMSSTSWKGVVHVPIADADAKLGLSLIWPESGPSSAAVIAIAAAAAVSERERWLA